LVLRLVTVARERAKRKRSLEWHLSPQSFKSLARQPGVLERPAQLRPMSFVVCRIRNFAELSESFLSDPDALARMVRVTMTPMVQAVLDRGGTIDRLHPGELGAFFNAPLDDPQHAIHACSCAIAMMEALEKINRLLEHGRRNDGSVLPPIDLGVGIYTGEAMAGDFGTGDMPIYTATGRAARLAGDIERISNVYGSAILAGGSTRSMAEKNFAFLEVDHVSLDAGASVQLYALLGTPLSRSNPCFIALRAFHDRIFQCYRAREWDKARALIAQARTLSGANPMLYDLYLKRIEHLERHPPSGNWSGVFPQALM
jgi:adenylate cyclase